MNVGSDTGFNGSVLLRSILSLALCDQTLCNFYAGTTWLRSFGGNVFGYLPLA